MGINVFLITKIFFVCDLVLFEADWRVCGMIVSLAPESKATIPYIVKTVSN